MINLYDIVDQVYLISEKNTKRYKSVMKQMEYINVQPKIIYHPRILFESINPKLDLELVYNNGRAKRYSNLKYNYFKCFCDAYKNNYNRILVFENDVRTIKDLNKFDVLNNLPKDFNLCMLDYQIPEEHICKYENRKIINGFFKFNYVLFSAAAIIYSKQAISNLIDIYLINNSNTDNVFQYINNKYAVNENLFIQYDYHLKRITEFYDRNTYITRNHLDLNNYYLYEP